MPAKQAPIVPANLIGILPLQDAVLFPHTVIPLAVVKKPGIQLVEEALREGKPIGLTVLKDREIEDPGPDDVQRVGTIGIIQKMLKVPDGTLRCIVAGQTGLPDRAVHASPPVHGRGVYRAARRHRRERRARRDAAQSRPASSRSCFRICRKRRARWRWKSRTSPIPTVLTLLRRVDDASGNRRSPSAARRARHRQAHAQAHDAAHQGARGRRARPQDSEPTSSARWRRISASSICASSCARFRKSSAKSIRSKPRPTSCARRSTKPGCPRT